MIDHLESLWTENLDPSLQKEVASSAIILWKSILEYSGDQNLYRKDILHSIQTESMGRGESVQMGLQMLAYYVRILKIDGHAYVMAAPMLENPVGIRSTQSPAPALLRYISAEKSLALRKTPRILQENIIAYIPRNSEVELISEQGKWSVIRYHRNEWYVLSEYLRDGRIEDDIRNGITPLSAAERSVVNVEQSLYTRLTPSTLSKIQWVLHTGEVVSILDRVGKWVEVSTDSFRGYIHQKYLSTAK